jgi:prepilin-type N-terminal cleavage/methylation domain-containing protein
MINKKQSGFTAVELLITLFVAAAFLVTGYQLYTIIIKDSGNTRAQARAANVAYDYIRRYSPSASNPCAASTPVNNSSINVSGLQNVTVTVNFTCPYSVAPASAPTITAVDIVVSYNSPQQSVEYKTYVNR